MRNYGRAVQISLLDWDWDGGRIARRAQNVPGDPVEGTPDSLEGVRGLYRRIGGLPQKAALYFCCEGPVCSSVRSERSVFPLTVITPQGPGILSLRYA